MTRPRPDRIPPFKTMCEVMGIDPFKRRVPAVLAKEVEPNEPEARVGNEPKPPQPKDDKWRNKDG